MGVTMTTVTRYQVTLVPLVTMSLMTPMVSAGSAYWWMGESGSFGGGGNDNGVGYGQQTQSQPQQIHNQPNVPHNSAGSNNVITSNNINAPNSGYELPATECAVGFKCVSEMFCDQSGTMVEYRVDLTQQQKKQRGQLVPCMNQALGIFQVCCRKPASFDSPRNPQQQQQSQPQQLCHLVQERNPTAGALVKLMLTAWTMLSVALMVVPMCVREEDLLLVIQDLPKIRFDNPHLLEFLLLKLRLRFLFRHLPFRLLNLFINLKIRDNNTQFKIFHKSPRSRIRNQQRCFLHNLSNNNHLLQQINNPSSSVQVQ